MTLMRAFVFLLPLLLAACASAPPSSSSGATRPTSELGGQAASHALKMVGKPYRFGGSSPAGFDCSGLVLYSYKQAGRALPHNTDKQRSISRSIKVAELRPGDLLFFNQEGKKYGHVGIYVGKGQFVHAPSSGKSVRSDRLDNPYWKKHLSEARRI
ncbi:MAG TPA: C40 family peptidase [Burkholderiales bacterium]|nr:C40 family peptidase [Burkholderiales bacterium]